MHRWQWPCRRYLLPVKIPTCAWLSRAPWKSSAAEHRFSINDARSTVVLPRPCRAAATTTIGSDRQAARTIQRPQHRRSTLRGGRSADSSCRPRPRRPTGATSTSRTRTSATTTLTFRTGGRWWRRATRSCASSGSGRWSSGSCATSWQSATAPRASTTTSPARTSPSVRFSLPGSGSSWAVVLLRQERHTAARVAAGRQRRRWHILTERTIGYFDMLKEHKHVTGYAFTERSDPRA